MMIGHACVGTKGLGDYPRAMANFEAALDIARAADLQWHIGPTLLGLDHVRACTGRYGEAWTGMHKTLRWLESLRQVRYQLIAYDFIGHLLLDLGLNELAVETAGARARARARHRHHVLARRDRRAPGGRALAARAERTSRRRCRPRSNKRAARSERYLMVRCLDGLAEIALAAGDAGRCRGVRGRTARASPSRTACANSRRARGAGAARLCSRRKPTPRRRQSCPAPRRWRQEIGRVRLQMDAEAALARLLEAQGQSDAARGHGAKARAIAEAIEKSLVSSGLEARLRHRRRCALTRRLRRRRRRISTEPDRHRAQAADHRARAFGGRRSWPRAAPLPRPGQGRDRLTDRLDLSRLLVGAAEAVGQEIRQFDLLLADEALAAAGALRGTGRRPRTRRRRW